MPIAVLPFTISYGSYSAIYNALSFVMASMGASTVYFFFHAAMMPSQGSARSLRTALCITGLVTLIAFYHYLRIFQSWTEAYEFAPVTEESTDYMCKASGKPFNDAYRYMDWLLTVPLLLIEIVFVMKLSDEETASKATSLGVASGLMIILGYPGELIIEGDLTVRWMWWTAAMIPFLFVVHTLLVGLSGAIQAESDPDVASKLWMVCYATVISWCISEPPSHAARNPGAFSAQCPAEIAAWWALQVHLPRRVPLPDARLHRPECRRGHPARLLRGRHHLEVRRRLPHLQHHHRQVGRARVQ